MKVSIALLVISALIGVSKALPSNYDKEVHQSELESNWNPAEEINQGELVRQKRFTCDLFSFQTGGFSINHSACATRCLIQGYKGGYCTEGTGECICRS